MWRKAKWKIVLLLSMGAFERLGIYILREKF